jgi:hypothetical protein
MRNRLQAGTPGRAAAVSRSLFRGATLLATGPLVAWFDRSDQDHEACAGFFQRYHGVFVSTWPVLTEVCHLTESLSLA